MMTGDDNDNFVKDSLQRSTSLYGIPLKVLTWNVNGKLDTIDEIREKLLFPTYYEMPTDDPKMVIIGLQEMVELSAANVIENSVAKTSSSTERFQNWKDMVLQVLQDRNPSYTYVGGECMVGIGLMVFCDGSLLSDIRNVQVQKLARGVGGVLGNKGAVYLRLDLMDSSLCFISAHFAAHREKVKKRNEDYHAILTTSVFHDLDEVSSIAPHWTVVEQQKVGKVRAEVDRVKRRMANALQNYQFAPRAGLNPTQSFYSTQSGMLNSSSYDMTNVANGEKGRDRSYSTTDRTNVSTSGTKAKMFSANDHDIVIFVGDLNYRIVASVDIMDVYEMIHGHELLRLASYDQLCQERERNRVFNGFNEGLLTFPPTYQFIPGKNVYDDRKDKKMRCPAWCDRILWRCGKPSKQYAPLTSTKMDSAESDTSDEDEPNGGDVNESLTISHRSIETTRAEVGSPVALPPDTPASVLFSPTNPTHRRAFFPDDPDRPPDSDDDDEAEGATKEPPKFHVEESFEEAHENTVVPESVEKRHSRPLPPVPKAAPPPELLQETDPPISVSDDDDDDAESDDDVNPRERSPEVKEAQQQRSEAIARRLMARNSVRLNDDPEFHEYIRRSSLRLSAEDSEASSLLLSLSDQSVAAASAALEGTITAESTAQVVDAAEAAITTSSTDLGSDEQNAPAPTLKQRPVRMEESIELISYHSCTNLISDHKPVSALMYLRVRRVDWARHEQRMVRCYSSMLYQADVQPLYSPSLDLTWHRVRLVSAPATLFVPEVHAKPSGSFFQLPGRRSTTTAHSPRSPRISSEQPDGMQPTCILLRSVNKDGSSATVEIFNRSPSLPALLDIARDSVPSWLSITISSMVILPQHSVQLTLRNDHTLSTLQLVHDVELYRDFAQENLRTIGKYLDLPPNDPAMQIFAYVRVSLLWSLEAMASHLRQQQEQLSKSSDAGEASSIPTVQEVENQYITKLFEGAMRGEMARHKRRGLVVDAYDDDSHVESQLMDEKQRSYDGETAETKPIIDVLPRKDSVQRQFVLPVVCSMAMDQSV